MLVPITVIKGLGWLVMSLLHQCGWRFADFSLQNCFDSSMSCPIKFSPQHLTHIQIRTLAISFRADESLPSSSACDWSVRKKDSPTSPGGKQDVFGTSDIWICFFSGSRLATLSWIPLLPCVFAIVAWCTRSSAEVCVVCSSLDAWLGSPGWDVKVLLTLVAQPPLGKFSSLSL